MLATKADPGGSRGLLCLGDVSGDLFRGAAAGFDSGACRSEERSCGADYGKNGRWVFRGVGAAVLCVQREGDGEQESEADKHKGGFLHWWVSVLGRFWYKYRIVNAEKNSGSYHLANVEERLCMLS